MSRKLGYIFLLLLVGFLFADVVYAQGLVGCKNDCTLTDLFLVVIRIINYLISLAGLVCMLFILWAGWNMITAGGNEEQIASAKQTLSNAVIGFFMVLVAFLLLDGILMIISGYGLQQALDFIF